MDCIFGVDIGGTNIKFGKFINDKLINTFQVTTIVNKLDPVNTIVDQIVSEIVNNLAGDNLLGVGVGVPGPVVDGNVKKAQNILWDEVPLKDILLSKFKMANISNLKIVCLNDANAATIGEWYYGNGEKCPNMVLVTLGTGIGGGAIINGQVYEGMTGAALEVGHIKIFPYDGRDCTCGLNGCLEQYASATGIIKTAYELRKNNISALNDKEILTAKDVFDLSLTDKIAFEVVDKTAYFLAIGLASIANVLNPNKIIIGGGVSKAKDILLEPLKKYFKQLAFYATIDTKIELASLYNDAGIYGCFYAVKEC